MQALGGFEAISKDAAPRGSRAWQGLRARLLRTALAFYRELQASLEEDASHAARSQLADAYARVADVTSELGQDEEALAAYQRSLALVEQIAAVRPVTPPSGPPWPRPIPGSDSPSGPWAGPVRPWAYEVPRIQEPLARDHPTTPATGRPSPGPSPISA